MNYSVSPVNISNSTFSDNNALNGSAIYNYGNGIAVTKVFIVNSTFSSKFNTQGGIIYTGYATTTIKNTIVALYSTGSICAGDVLVDNGNNLQWPDTSCGNTITSSDPKLGPLADNGGPTQTRALLPGSPAINAGDNTTCVNPPVNNLDQRGNIRYSGGADCDIGAYEADNSILAAPSLSLAFNPASIVAGATTTLNLNLTNPNGQPLNNVSFTDNLPAQLKIANTNPTAINNCNNGTVSAPAGSGTISVSGVGLNPYQSCSITIKITSSSVGGWINTINSISSTETGTVTTSASANLSVTAPSPPTFTQGFNPPSIASGSISRLSFTLTNPNLVALTNASFSDTMPSQLQIANPSNLSNICGSGSVTATAGSSSISASGVNLAAGQTCTISLDVTSTTLGSWNNTTGPISATESGAGQPSNTATLRVFNQLIVTTTADDAATPPAGSLRQAVAEAGGQGGAIVSFDPALGTNPQINLVTPLLIPANVLIEASCTNRVRLNATFANSIQLSGGNYLQGLQIFSSVMPIIKARGGGNELKCTSANKV